MDAKRGTPRKRRKNIKRYTVTAALPYANGPKHIGHLAGAYLPADIYVRYLRLTGKDVVFVCGSDEHGTAIPNRAAKEKITPKEIIDKYHNLTLDCFRKLGISFDVYHRTSDPLHRKTAQSFFRKLIRKKVMYKESELQFYDERADRFLADRYVRGMCPKCGYKRAYGDQCEDCGVPLNPNDLLLPRSTITGEEPIRRPTTHWYLPLPKYEKWLHKWLDHYLKKRRWKPGVLAQCMALLKGGLRSRAMTRDLDWGVPVPNEPGKMLYVWFDAPIGYISATRALFRELAKGKFKYATPQRDFGEVSRKDWEKYWKEDSKLIHFIGKDNIIFHCIIFPVMLHTSGEYVLPENVPANEFMNLEGNKMSTSEGWSVEMHEYLRSFPGMPDSLRYTLLSRLPETRDSEFTWKAFRNRNNNELVAALGNFVHRTLVMIENHFNSKVPKPGSYEPVDKVLIAMLKEVPESIADAIESFRFKEANKLMINVARAGNKYLNDNEPWKVLKTDKQRAATILYLMAQTAANLTILAEPFLPFTAQKLHDMLGVNFKKWSKAGKITLLKKGHKLNKSKLLFRMVEDKEIKEQMSYLRQKRLKRLPETLRNR